MKNVLTTLALAVLVFAAFQFGKHLYLRPKNITGAEAPPVSGLLADGRSFSLNQLRGQYVVLEFWGSWCGPCRAGHPEFVTFYREFRDRAYEDGDGLAVVSVGIEQNAGAWRQAIQADGLDWPHHLMTQAGFDDPILKAYTVKQIPTRFLINPAGRIMAVDPSVSDLRKLLGERTKA